MTQEPEFAFWLKDSDETHEDRVKRRRRMAGIQEPKVNKSKLGRNEPCFCGSGRKYKWCCFGLDSLKDEDDFIPTEFEPPKVTVEEVEDLKASILRRIKIRAQVEYDPDKQAEVKAVCAKDPIAFVNDWCWTYDPRMAGVDGMTTNIPFDLFPRQRQLIEWAHGLNRNGVDGIAEKSRETGCTWTLLAGLFLHQWLFVRGFNGGLGSRKEEYVDTQGDPRALFEKLRFLLRNLPGWMLPEGFVIEKHCRHMRIVNPENGSTITGEAGDNIGRGDRKTVYLVDEAPYIQGPESADAALSQTSRCTIWLGTPNEEGMSSLFARKRWSGAYHVFTYRWQQDPRKDEEWYKRQCEKYAYNPGLIARELDIDYHGAAENQAIPGLWVRAAIELHLPTDGTTSIGLDIADTGTSLNVAIVRRGPVVTLDAISSWSGMDTTQSTKTAVKMAEDFYCERFNYDSVGVGAAVRGVLVASGDVARFRVKGVDGRGSPTKTRYEDAPDKIAKVRFRNLRTELWWALRRRFQKTWEHVNGKATYPLDELISIPLHMELIAQISLPTYYYLEGGKIALESKDDMRRRKIKSPDFADALVYAFADSVESSGAGWLDSLLGR